MNEDSFRYAHRIEVSQRISRCQFQRRLRERLKSSGPLLSYIGVGVLLRLPAQADLDCRSPGFDLRHGLIVLGFSDRY